MNTQETAFIIDDNSQICEIVDGRNVSFDDGHTYKLSDDGEIMYRIDGQSFINGEFTPYASREALEVVINPPKAPGFG